MTVQPNPNAKLWLLDFDNTLAALEREVDWPGSRRELEACLRSTGVDQKIFDEIPKGNLPLYAALHSRWLRTSVTAQNSAAPSLEVAQALLARSSEIIERHELAGVERAQPTPGAIDLLRAIAARDAVAIIVTSNSSRTVARWLEIHRVSHLIRDIVGRDSLLALKPSPEMVARALELAAIPPAAAVPIAISGPIAAAETVFVGDSEADFGAARAAGLGLYGIAASPSSRDRLVAAGAGAINVFASPSALLLHLNALNRLRDTSKHRP